MVILEKHHKDIVKSVLAKYSHDFFVFGSRAKGTAKTFSDLDLCCFDKISLSELAHLSEDFEESNLPFKVDIIDWEACSETFKQSIVGDLISLST
jgi:uncharacterized protein